MVLNRLTEPLRRFPGVGFEEVNFPPNAHPAEEEREHSYIYPDKGARVAVGLSRLYRNPTITHVMVVDADDYVSNGIAGLVRANPPASGWYVDEGYVYSDLSKLIAPLPEFWSRCGTSHVLRRDLLRVPEGVSSRLGREEILSLFDPTYLSTVIGDHVMVRAYAAREGNALLPMPFRGAIWLTDTQENSSRVIWNQQRFGPIWGERVSPEIQREFNLSPTARTPLQAASLLYWRSRNLAGRVFRRGRSCPLQS